MVGADKIGSGDRNHVHARRFQSSTKEGGDVKRQPWHNQSCVDRELLLAELKQKIAAREVVAIIGSGVSIQVTHGEPCASWSGLLKDGAQRCGGAVELSPLIDSGKIGMMLAAAEAVATELGAPDSGEYRLWLRDTVGALSIKEHGLIDAIHSLGSIIATTNYDDLITRDRPVPAVPWTKESEVEEIVRGNRAGVIHLHGFFDAPESVVLGIRSYDQVVGSKHAQAILHALRMTKTLLFIGCGDGLADPNLGALLAWSAEVFQKSPYRHFRLCRDVELEQLQNKHPPEQRLFPLAYG